MTEFVPFPKIGRLSREIIITEKIDGTNACVHIGETGEFLTGSRSQMRSLLQSGSQAAPGFMKPEGVVIFHSQSGALLKKTFEKDDAGKGRETDQAMP
jgi:hypothetical protein